MRLSKAPLPATPTQIQLKVLRQSRIYHIHHPSQYLSLQPTLHLPHCVLQAGAAVSAALAQRFVGTSGVISWTWVHCTALSLMV
jgi:hypothetical protein